MVYSERIETSAVSCGNSRVNALKYTTLVDIKISKEPRYEKLATHRETHASVVSLL